MLSSLSFRLWLTYVLVAAVVIVTAGVAVVVYLIRNPTVDRVELQRLRVLSNFLVQRSQAFNVLPENVDSQRLGEAVRRADSLTGVRVAVYTAAGELLADSRADSQTGLPELNSLLDRSVGKRPIYRDESQHQWLYTLTPIQQGFYLLLTAPRARLPVLGILRDEFLAPFIRGALLALFLSLVLAFWITRWVAAPLQRMADAARAVSAGEFQKLPLEGPQEVQEVAHAFNEMGAKVQATQRSQRDFIANVSHDLKTPLTSIQGFAQAILDGTVSDAAALRQAAEVIHSEAERMYRMVLDLLELARLDSGVAQIERLPLDIGELLSAVVEEFAPQSRLAQVELRLDLGEASQAGSEGGALLEVVGDPDRLAQVFTNLIDNALKYTPPGGQVTVTAASAEGWIEVRVADSGPGITAAELERIFERFYQTDKSRRGGGGRGVGLGLAIAREIVQAHGGAISAQRVGGSGAAAGSVFVVRLPLEPHEGGVL